VFNFCSTFVQQKDTKYLQKRNNIYYFSKRMNKKHIKISLKSGNLEYCIMLRDKIIKRLEMPTLEQVLNKIKNRETLTKEEASLAYGEETIKQQEKNHIQLTPQEQEELTNYTFKEEIETSKKIKELEQNKDNQILEIVKTLQQQQTPQTQPINNNLKDNLDKYFNNFLEHKKNFDKVSQASLTSYKSSLHYLKYFIDENTIFNFTFFKQLQKNLQELPTNFFKYSKYNTKTFNEVVKFKNKYQTMNNKTVNKHMINYKLFFNYLTYEEIIKENPLNNIKQLLEEKNTIKEEYTQYELENIFNSDIEKEYLNMCKIALYTGLRVEELLTLKKEDIKDNCIHLNLEDKSTKKHTRIIPIHKNIINTLEEQKKANKGVFLFLSEASKSEVSNMGKKVNRRLRKIVNNKNKSFHSLRKNFSQEVELNTNAEEKTKKYLMGHTFSKDVTHMIYNRGKMNLEKLRNCINQISFNY